MIKYTISIFLFFTILFTACNSKVKDRINTNTTQNTQSTDKEGLVKAVSVGFYNLENLFDYENDTLINDEEFLPRGRRAWTQEKYEEKQANMAYVISQLGIDV
ncbi:MAG: hypothetical protein V3V14_01995, partial [Saprospiraceae bacterium]